VRGNTDSHLAKVGYDSDTTKRSNEWHNDGTGTIEPAIYHFRRVQWRKYL